MDVLLATTNPGKRREFAQLLTGLPFTVITPDELGLDLDVEEGGDSFEANAAIKATAWAKTADMVCVADDSGLCVVALDNAPGIYSARWGAMHQVISEGMDGAAIDVANRDLIVAQLADQPNRDAFYVCVAALAWPDGHVITTRGEWHGRIIEEARGDYGFGYDPVFVPDGETRTAAELQPEEKNAASHRAKAFAQLRSHFEALAQDNTV